MCKQNDNIPLNDKRNTQVVMVSQSNSRRYSLYKDQIHFHKYPDGQVVDDVCCSGI